MKSHRCWAEIDRAALRHNARVVRELLPGGTTVAAVIKANAYGHGLAAVAHTLADEVDLFGVANLIEATEARRVVSHPLLILGPALPEERAEIVAQGFIPAVSTLEEATDYSKAAAGGSVSLNFKIDTGMGRMGFPEHDAIALLNAVAALPNVQLHSVSTHLPAADEDTVYTQSQLARVRELIARMRAEVPGSYKVHALPSAGVIGFRDSAFDMVRAGLMLYGASPMAEFQERLRPVMSVKTHVVLIRDVPAGTSISYGRTFITKRPTRVATLSVGYADGYRRSLSNRGAYVLVRGQRCPVLGRVTMDLTMVDVTEVSGLEIGDEAVLIGRQGGEQILAREVAERAGTIAWEIFTGIGTRVTRVYV
ncbi:MAG TPA: alanine racemase [Chthoniobacterales bacterium]|nr:alanine racemase [Chthoniobacterales bacterium]